ncbi:uncharacterized protein LOC119726028 [Patiria miniata]|uniref:Uncharacterized protein n=1 Tax=Patiria miniata TaxID=46514 RepID=A0A913ZR05_PATMI|nr:uncharacterized protein LOC119726028 [Patiria miniata]
MTLSLNQEKIVKIISHCQEILEAQTVTVRQLSSLIGRLSSTILAVFQAQIFYRSLQEDKISALRRENSYESAVTLSQASLEELRTWVQCLHAWNGRHFLHPTPDLTLQTDASMSGWGACLHSTIGGRWTTLEQQHHINYLELLAVWYAIRSLLAERRDIHVLLQMDSSTAIAYINHQGGTHSVPMSRLAVKIWVWCLKRNITLAAQHIPGSQNITADRMSRVFDDRAEWQLLPEVFRSIMDALHFVPSVDLFASRLNTQLETFVSWQPNPMAWRVNALLLNWKDVNGYAFPPFSLLLRILQKIRREEATVVLVAPVWKTQAWYPMLLELAIDVPLLLPRRTDLLQLPHNRSQVHPLIGHLQLAAWKLSGQISLQRDFHRRCQPQSLLLGDHSPMPSITQHGEGGQAGVYRGNLIQFTPL